MFFQSVFRLPLEDDGRELHIGAIDHQEYFCIVRGDTANNDIWFRIHIANLDKIPE